MWNNFRTTRRLSGLMGLCLAVGYLVGGRAALFPAFAIGAGMNLLAYFFSDKIALATMRAVQIGPHDDPALWQIAQTLAGRAGLPMPRVYISPAPAPNAFATGRNPKHSAVCVTQGLRQMLSRDELEGVIAHELSHIKHRDILISTIAAVIAGAISWLTYLVFWGGSDRRSNPLVALVLMILAPLAAGLLQMAISRSREFEADRGAAELLGNGHNLANALERIEVLAARKPMMVAPAQAQAYIHNPLSELRRGRTAGMARMFSTHPATEERIARLRAM